MDQNSKARELRRVQVRLGRKPQIKQNIPSGLQENLLEILLRGCHSLRTDQQNEGRQNETISPEIRLSVFIRFEKP